MIPILCRSWLMKTTRVLERLMLPVSLRSAWLIRRACRPGSWSPISPSISALGVSAATESTTTTSTAFERTSMSAISSACSPVSGWETSRSRSEEHTSELQSREKLVCRLLLEKHSDGCVTCFTRTHVRDARPLSLHDALPICLQAGQLVAHLALDLGLGRERGHRVDHHHVDRVRAHQHVGDLQRLLAGVGLGDQQVEIGRAHV